VTEGLPMERVTVGRSIAHVWRVGDQFYLKTASRGDELAAEMARLNWLAGRAPVPKVIAFERGATETYLLTGALKGVAAHEAASPGNCVDAVAAGLRRLHRLDIAACPFDARLAVTIELARGNALAGRVDESDFDPSRAGRGALELLADVEATRPADEDLVVTHGDYCLPNVILSAGGGVAGFVDLGRAGVADRYQDLALAARSIAYNFGDAHVAAFFAAYGIDPDPRRIAFYQLLDEFF
jgi:aminoglycoside 3'-phosphotransferase-2